MAFHDESDLVCSAGAAALANPSTATFRWQPWEGGAPRHSPPVALCHAGV